MDINVFQRNDIAAGVNTSKYSGGTEFIPVSYLQDQSHADQLEKKMLKLFVLSCTMNANGDIKRINTSYGAKKAKISGAAQNQQFNRLFICADLRAPPKVCAIITRNPAEITILMKKVGGGPFVGTTFFMFEPGLVTSTLGDFTPIVNWSEACFLPVQNSLAQLTTTHTRFSLPSYSGQTHYFVLTEKTIRVRNVKYCPKLACLGIQCDRQKTKAGGCSCVHASGTGNSNVYGCNITFDVPATVETSGRVTVFEFTSYSFTKLFFTNFEDFAASNSWSDVDDSQNLVRRKWERLVHYVNNHGGWSLVGWCMLGDHYDAATGNEKVDNFETKIHLSKVHPTLQYAADLEEFNRLKINENFVLVNRLDNSDSDNESD